MLPEPVVAVAPEPPLATASVPELMLEALVVSVVAEVANPRLVLAVATLLKSDRLFVLTKALDNVEAALDALVAAAVALEAALVAEVDAADAELDALVADVLAADAELDALVA